jgi:hypothetical protein
MRLLLHQRVSYECGHMFGMKEFGFAQIYLIYWLSISVIWAEDEDGDEDFDAEVDDIFSLDFEEEDYQESLDGSPMMPW